MTIVVDHQFSIPSLKIAKQRKMHKFIVSVGLVGNNPMEEVSKVKDLFELALKNAVGTEPVRMFMKERLGGILSKPFMIWLDPMGRSHFLNIFVVDRRNIVMSACYTEMNTLLQISTYNLAKFVKDWRNVEDLEVPGILKKDVKQICKQLELKFVTI